ncbi:MAG: ABC transporter permease [Candidatus Bipolaricaulia bacterium]
MNAPATSRQAKPTLRQRSRSTLSAISTPFRQNRLMLVGIALIVFMVAMTIFAPWLSPYSPIAQTQERLASPSLEHPMGTDQLQRDLFSRVIHGGKVPLQVAVLSVLLALTAGSMLGWISGFAGGLVDRIMALLMDALYSFPGLILALALISVFGRGVLPMVMAVTVIYIPTYFRVVRGQVFQIREMEYVEAARALGYRWIRTLLRHIAPNTLSSMLVIVPFNLADAILIEAGLSFLGFGIQPPTPDWGFDISNGQDFLLSGHWWLVTFPGLMIILISLGFGMLGEGISDWLNPRRSRS